MVTADELGRSRSSTTTITGRPGDVPLVLSPMTPARLPGSSAIENWHRITTIRALPCTDSLPISDSGLLEAKHHARYLKDLCLPDGWPWKVSLQHRA